MPKLEIIITPLRNPRWPNDLHFMLAWGSSDNSVGFWLTKKERKQLRKALKNA